MHVCVETGGGSAEGANTAIHTQEPTTHARHGETRGATTEQGEEEAKERGVSGEGVERAYGEDFISWTSKHKHAHIPSTRHTHRHNNGSHGHAHLLKDLKTIDLKLKMKLFSVRSCVQR